MISLLNGFKNLEGERLLSLIMICSASDPNERSHTAWRRFKSHLFCCLFFSGFLFSCFLFSCFLFCCLLLCCLFLDRDAFCHCPPHPPPFFIVKQDRRGYAPTLQDKCARSAPCTCSWLRILGATLITAKARNRWVPARKDGKNYFRSLLERIPQTCFKPLLRVLIYIN
jgi:hypothetical protein